jgi:hypothetical protein
VEALFLHEVEEMEALYSISRLPSTHASGEGAGGAPPASARRMALRQEL